jgi:hypothetical protein
MVDDARPARSDVPQPARVVASMQRSGIEGAVTKRNRGSGSAAMQTTVSDAQRFLDFTSLHRGY